MANEVVAKVMAQATPKHNFANASPVDKQAISPAIVTGLIS